MANHAAREALQETDAHGYELPDPPENPDFAELPAGERLAAKAGGK